MRRASEPTTTISAVRNERLDIRRKTLLRAAVAVEPPLEDERRCLLIDHGAALLARHIGIDQHALGLRGRDLVRHRASDGRGAHVEAECAHCGAREDTFAEKKRPSKGGPRRAGALNHGATCCLRWWGRLAG